MNEYLEKVVRKALDMGAFDIHLKAAFSPIVRLAGTIHRLEEFPALSPKEMEKMALEMMDDKRRTEFRTHGQADCSIEVPGVCRARINVFLQRNSLALSMRIVPPRIRDLKELGFPQEITDMMLKANKGLILVTGATNSGKSTTVAALVHLLAMTEPLHIISIEDPIEYIFPTYENSIVNQRQVGEDTISFQQGLISALREDPDVIMIGELRDQETVEISLRAAETGHLVLGTLHTSSAAQSLTRMINVFPSHQRDSIRFMLSSSLKAIVSQMLLPSADHKSRVLAFEVLPMLPSVCNLLRQRKIHEIQNLMAIGRGSGCVPMIETVRGLVKSGKVRAEDVPKEMRTKGGF